MATATQRDRAGDLSAALKIDGWLSSREAGTLYDMAANANGPIVEIGSWQGRSTAVLALGSMSGRKHPVFAVDSYDGVPPTDRITARGIKPGWKSSSPEVLRFNLDAAGVNGLVRIVPKASHAAADDVPAEVSLLFVDGGHDYETVKRDLELYLPRVATNGWAVLHDCTDGDPGVVRAVNKLLIQPGNEWRISRRVDSAIVLTKRIVERRRVKLAFPGGSLIYGAAKGLLHATLGSHDVAIDNSCNGWDDMNLLWVKALNEVRHGEISHFAMLHSDVAPDPGWLDVLIGEMEDRGADLISTVLALKDERGLTSCGIGDKDSLWGAFRRFTMRELVRMPETFDVSDTPHPDRYLLHNTGCWVCDIRKPAFQTENPDGSLKAFFNFPLRVEKNADGDWIHLRESEDWFFSRQIAELPLKTCITRKVAAYHVGSAGYGNDTAWGTYLKGDNDTRAKWEQK